MTIDDQLREIARHVDQHQRAIRADEIVQRASVHDVTLVTELRPSNGSAAAHTPTQRDRPHQRHRRRPWVLVAAATIVVAALGLLAVNAADGPDKVRPATIPPTPAPSSDPLPASTTIDTATATPSTSVASIAPGGGAIAFAADTAAGATLTDPLGHWTAEVDPEPMDIYVTRDGEPVRRLVWTAASERCPAFSPDGRRLSYLQGSSAGLDPSIVVVRLEATGAGAQELRVPLGATEWYSYALTRSGVPCPQWSPDGSRLAYLAFPTVDAIELRVVTLDGQERVVSFLRGSLSQEDGQYSWSPDGDEIAYVASNEVWIAPLDGGEPRVVWRPVGWPTAVSWSSRDELAVAVRTTVDLGGGFSRDILSSHIVDIATGTEQQLGVLHVYDYLASWSPDGSQLAYVGEDGHIVISDRGDGSTVSLSPRQDDGSGFDFWDVAWSPEGERLLALAHSEDRGYALVSLSPDGASADVITPWTWGFDWIGLGDVSWQPITS